MDILSVPWMNIHFAAELFQRNVIFEKGKN